MTFERPQIPQRLAWYSREEIGHFAGKGPKPLLCPLIFHAYTYNLNIDYPLRYCRAATLKARISCLPKIWSSYYSLLSFLVENVKFKPMSVANSIHCDVEFICRAWFQVYLQALYYRIFAPPHSPCACGLFRSLSPSGVVFEVTTSDLTEFVEFSSLMTRCFVHCVLIFISNTYHLCYLSLSIRSSRLLHLQLGA